MTTLLADKLAAFEQAVVQKAEAVAATVAEREAGARETITSRLAEFEERSDRLRRAPPSMSASTATA